tara:strand:+ start:173 stop:370 length:198 start_codon:yes stop_codon:yes gene_type:complete
MLHKLVQLGLMEMRMAVLDSIFRVRGVNGLKVSHASVFPRSQDFIALPIYIVSEKATDVILADVA